MFGFIPLKLQHLFSAACLIAILAPGAWADLSFEKTRQTVLPDLLDDKAEAVYLFTNTGETPVKIERVQTSCGCTVAGASDSLVQPGESSEIKATFSFGDRYGKQIKRIIVTTDDPKQPKITLTLVADVPQVTKFKPKLLTWRGEDQERQAKQTVLTVMQDPRVKLVGLGELPEGFKVDLEQPDAKKKPGQWHVTIDPSLEVEAKTYHIPVKLLVDKQEVVQTIRVRLMELRPELGSQSGSKSGSQPESKVKSGHDH